MADYTIRLLESPEDMTAVEDIQRIVWPGSETEIVPTHILITVVHNGGIVLGAFSEETLVGFIFGFPGLDMLPDGPHPKHCSHMLGVHPDWRDSGVGFALKRAQWQMVRHQGLDHVTWTYDPLLSRNAYLNIAKLGTVCNTYRRSEYGDLRDGLNVGLPTDRFQVDWWLNTARVKRRLSRRSRGMLKLDQFAKADLQPLYTLHTGTDGLLRPPEHFSSISAALLLAEIPSDFMTLKAEDFALARDWRFFTREVFETTFAEGYLITDFIFDRTSGEPHSMYVLTDGNTTLEDHE
ncbi:MAG: GNAT family N-acetyltransferase [Anaerolineales bacterium]|nr:GNAT family N-acetyltransferase [Anaerolineales bacterium]